MNKKINPVGCISNGINQKFGMLEIKLLSYLQLRKLRIVRTGDIVQALGISKQRENTLLSNLCKKNAVIRLKRGVYLASRQLPSGGFSFISEYEILEYLMKEYGAYYMVSGPTAMYYYGYTEQIPNKIYVYNDQIYGEKQIGSKSFVFMKTAAKRLKGSELVKMNDGSKIPFATKSRFLIDCIYDWNRYNTIPAVYLWISKEINRDSAFTEKLISNANRYGNKSVQKRLGYLLETLNVDSQRLEKLQRKINAGKSFISYIPNKKARGKINKKWGLIINAE
ncbi:MAG: type IV toxin-antitoxin system AbiEi family antitoxin domain-containing protein [Candidatus Cloacimonetes bacterium]|nr:type IV toxin-antitoxin system AbiEi family antitoxin domain-containing protein [Candidatus Cloacimonadota bacterium]